MYTFLIQLLEYVIIMISLIFYVTTFLLTPWLYNNNISVCDINECTTNGNTTEWGSNTSS